MAEVNIVRIDQTEHSTVSKCYVDDEFICFIIEDGEHENKIHGSTRIPHGRYRLVRQHRGRFKDSYSNRFGHEYVWRVEHVPGFVGILIHMGNTIADTRGCLLPNRDITLKKGHWRGVNSKNAYLTLFDALDDETEHMIDIIR